MGRSRDAMVCIIRSMAVASLLLTSQSSSAATLAATVVDDVLEAGQTTTVSVSLELDTGEVASVFEGTIALLGSPTNVTGTITGPVSIGASWVGAQQNVAGSQVSLSLTSSEAGGNRLLASFEITAGQEPGTLTVLVVDGAFAQEDIDQAPFVMDVPIDNVGLSLSQITIVPEPVQLLSGSVGLVMLAALSRSRKGGLATREAPPS